MMRILFTIIISLLIFKATQAALIVVNNTGQTVNAASFVKAPPHFTKAMIQKIMQQHENDLDNVHYNINELPYPRESHLTPGRVRTRQLKTPSLSIPIFIIGDDPQSIQWSNVNAKKLKSIHALGFITNVESAARVKEIEQQTGLLLMPGSLNGVLDKINVKHYPFLWTKDDIEQ